MFWFNRKRKSYFSEITFANEYYLEGVNIFDDRTRKLIKMLEVVLPNNVAFKEMNHTGLFEVSGKTMKFKIAISQINFDFYVISFLSGYQFRRVSDSKYNRESILKNKKILIDVATAQIKREKNNSVFYSEDYQRRAVIGFNDNIIKMHYELLQVEDEINFNFYDNISSSNFWHWENFGETSFFDTIENAKKEAISALKVK